MTWDEVADKAPPADDSWRKSPAKKNTKAWCKGKIGRAHIPEIRVSSYHSSMYEKYPCRVVESFGRYWLGSDSDLGDNRRWVCYHEEYCSNCGKILTPSGIEIKQCPEFMKMFPEPAL